MGFVVGLMIGLGVGWAIASFLGAEKVSTQSAAIQDLKRQLDLAESEHDRRLRVATTQLRKDYDAQLQAAQVLAAQVVSPEPTPPNSMDSPPSATSEPIGSPSSLIPVRPEPEVFAPPATTTVSTPTSQAIVENPQISETQPIKSVPTPTIVTGMNHSSILLAASYASNASTRGDVAATIAALLPTTRPKEHARWLPVLSRLVRDADSGVRLQAVEALANIKSPKRLPLLRRALRDTTPAVVGAASAIIAQSKRRSQPRPNSQKRRLPKNR